ncbi:VanZ family protein [Eubacterium oxidoreducens]|uniref:Glycopeptide antibiotics resistance protein n=1 Tax=Eubacterium oxidoreducens TaxID=1732 RepID=A0A1G6CK91_EUBOX|nr:VanZ family protein [Eubacterium oxidoreducens]SDB33314.1 Glycopeptide antibiotics resistance protein [Eubacterium oxidoreducens]
MIGSQFIAVFFGFILVNFVFIGVLNSDFKNKQYLSLCGCIFSLMIIVCICFFPFPFQSELIESMIDGNEGLSNNFIPLKSIVFIVKDSIEFKVYGMIFYQIFGNILLFMPLGFSLFCYLKEKNKFFKILCCVLFTSVFVEVGQCFFNTMIEVNYRSVDIDDILLNTLGGILGFRFAYSIIPKFNHLLNKTKKECMKKFL